ncbi:AAA family ATPase [Rhizobium sp. Leaf306]|uniref:AAA family ATPase n=1 Tax=Rhizobium sp. Leaf306 TaxID=1736330 RepID=UPI000A4D3977|nr:AAA family ATPase [Rhizobium sp. Leaf306]
MEEKANCLSKLPLPLCRVLIFGNGGSGKTWLATRMGEALGHHPIHLDDVHWEPGRYGIARDRQVVDDDVCRIAAQDVWLIEGVYGRLASLAITRATTLIFLDIADDVCLENIRHRGLQGGGSVASFEELLHWVAGYRFRHNNWNSFEAHDRMFSAFEGPKHRLDCRDSVNAYLASLSL